MLQILTERCRQVNYRSIDFKPTNVFHLNITKSCRKFSRTNVEIVPALSRETGLSDKSRILITDPAECTSLPVSLGQKGITPSPGVTFPVSHLEHIPVSCEEENYVNSGSDQVTCNVLLYEEVEYKIQPRCIIGRV